MFEQSLYEQRPVAAPLREGDLFHNYEIKSWNMSSRIYKILGLSAVGNIIAILVVAQTSLLTMKGCDSPLVGSVCQVLDTVYVGSKLLGTDREYVDAEYDTIKLEDEDITYLDLTGIETQPLSYPDGYFQIANPPQAVTPENPFNEFAYNPPGGELAPGIPYTQPSTGGKSLIDTPPVYPKQKKDVVDGDLPSFGNSPIPGIYDPPIKARKKAYQARIKPLKTPQDTVAGGNPTVEPTPAETPQPTPMSSEAVMAVEINKKPLTDFADDIVTKTEAKEVDLNQPFLIVLNGVIAADGKLDKEKSKFDVSKQKGDPKMIDVAKTAMEALGESGYLSYLKSLNVDKVTVTLIQDDNQINAVITSTQKTPELAKTVSSGINGYISIGKLSTKDPSDERTLLNGASVTADGKNFVLNFVIPKPIAQEMITRKLKEAQAKKAQQPKPNGNAIIKPANNASVE
jgi:hypothetical protein